MALLKGLDATELKLSEVDDDNPILRYDASYFNRAALESEAKIKRGKWEKLREAADEIESFGAYDLTNYFRYVESGIPFLRCVNIRDGFSDFSDVLYVDVAANKLLAKSAIRPGMVLLTMSGSVGNATVALPSWRYPVNSNQDIAKITPKPGVDPCFVAAFLGSKFGKVQMERLPVGSVQQHVFLWMIERIVLARFSPTLEKSISEVVSLAYKLETGCTEQLAAVERILLRTLGLEDWQPSEPLTYTRRASEVAAAHRFDSVYFSPAKSATVDMLNIANAKPLSAYVAAVREMVLPEIAGAHRKVLNFDVSAASHPVIDGSSTTVDEFDSAKKRFRPGDVVISRLRHYLRQIAVVRTSEEAMALGSSEFIVLRGDDEALPPEALALFLRCRPVQTILEYSQDGSHHPRFSDEDLLAIPVPPALLKVAPQLVQGVRSAHAARREAQALLARAQRTVEIAIEQDEKTALASLR